MGEIILELDQIRKSFGGTPVLNGISLSIEHGEFITFLGSSGCGKTTTLRIIAGLEEPDSGRVLLGGADVTNLEPNRRDVNTVFQNYALFPHMDVYTNIAYGLKLRKTDKAEIKRRVTAMLELVQLSGFEKRLPSELSGGQKQRVAIARAVINNPKVLLLDEPLGALDLQLRRQMQTELKRLQKQLGITFIYITHDQEEAINMSDRIVVMKDGRFEQIGTPDEIYDRPKTSYVAGFVGAANIIRGTVKRAEADTAYIAVCGGCVESKLESEAAAAAAVPGRQVTLAVRSENIRLTREVHQEEPLPKKAGMSCENGFIAVIKEKTFAGGMLRIVLDAGEAGELISSRQGINCKVQAGDQVRVNWDAASAVLVDLEGQHEEK